MNQVRASHILLPTEERALELREELDRGADFARLAAAHSTCPSAKDGGDLGWFQPGMMVKEFEEVVFALDENETAGPVRTGFGWHLIRLTGKKHPTMRVSVSSDLHFDLTGPEPLRRLVAGMDREDPDLVVLCGDLGNPSRHFSECLRVFLKLDRPVAVLPGNHDLWSSPGETSILLFEEILPQITEEYGFHWLENSPLVLPNGTALCGSIGWYDSRARNGEGDFIGGVRHDWEYDDEEFAARCRNRLCEQMAELEKNEKVQRILGITHVPCFETQLEERPEDAGYTADTPYYAHLTLGEALRAYKKLRWVVSGHTHLGLNGLIERPGMPPIATAVVGSDYGKPRWVTVEV